MILNLVFRHESQSAVFAGICFLQVPLFLLLKERIGSCGQDEGQLDPSVDTVRAPLLHDVVDGPLLWGECLDLFLRENLPTDVFHRSIPRLYLEARTFHPSPIRVYLRQGDESNSGYIWNKAWARDTKDAECFLFLSRCPTYPT